MDARRSSPSDDLHFDLSVESSTDAAILHRGAEILSANAAALALCGATHLTQVVGQPVLGFIHEEDRPIAETQIRRNLAGEDVTVFREVRIRRLDGEVIWVEAVGVRVEYAGRPATLEILRDVSESKRLDLALRESEQRYRALVDASPDAIFVHDGDRLLFGNPAALRMIGAASPGEVLDRPVMSFAHPDDRALLAERSRAIITRGETAQPREVRIIRMDGTAAWVEAIGVRIDFGGRPVVQTVMQDISARKERNELEQARATRLQSQSSTLLALAIDPVMATGDLRASLRVITESAARILTVNSASVWLFDTDRATLRCLDRYDADTDSHRYDLGLKAAPYTVYFAALETDRSIAVADAQTDPRTSELSGEYLVPFNVGALLDAPVRLSGELIGVICLEQHERGRLWHADEVAFAGGLADQVSHSFASAERARAAHEMRVMAGRLMQLQDEERRRIGRELHDSTGQVLAALELSLDRVLGSTSQVEPRTRALLSQCAQLARQCSQEIRTAAYLLHPPLLDELGLPTALRWLVDGFTARSNIKVTLELPDKPLRLPPDQELSLFRVLQEALSNVHKHSGSPTARVRLTIDERQVCIEVRDFGRGMRPGGSYVSNTQNSRTGVGLAGMRERLHQLGGDLRIDSDASGTCITASVPVAEHSGAAATAVLPVK